MIINNQPSPTKTNTELPLASEEDQEIDFSPLIGYLQSPQGHEIASRVVRIIEDGEINGVRLD